MHIGDYLGRREIYSPDKLAIVDMGKKPERRLTYRQLNRRANRLANWLRDVAGVGKGDRVAILARDGVEHLDLFYACGKLGAIHTALNWRLHWRELAGLIENTAPKVLIYSDDFKSAVAEIQAASWKPRQITDTDHRSRHPPLSPHRRPWHPRQPATTNLPWTNLPTSPSPARRWRPRTSPACSLPAAPPGCPRPP